MIKILIVDDELENRKQLEWAAKGDGRDIIVAEGSIKAKDLINQNNFDVVVTDLRMESEKAGLDVLKSAKNRDFQTQVIVITAYGTPAISVEAMRLGAFDYIERNSPGTDTLAMIQYKINLAIEYQARHYHQ